MNNQKSAMSFSVILILGVLFSFLFALVFITSNGSGLRAPNTQTVKSLEAEKLITDTGNVNLGTATLKIKE